MKRTRDGKALYLHCLPADITGVSCKEGEVEVQSLAVSGALHHVLGAGPVFELGILGQQLLFQRVDARLIVGGMQLGALLHGGKGDVYKRQI